jgi:hypothetical protein
LIKYRLTAAIPVTEELICRTNQYRWYCVKQAVCFIIKPFKDEKIFFVFAGIDAPGRIRTAKQLYD